MRSLLPLLLILSACKKQDAPSAPSEPKARCVIALQWNKGDKIRVQETEKLEGRMTLQFPAGEKKQDEIVTTTTDFQDEVLEVDSAARIAAVRRHVKKFEIVTQPIPDGEARTQKASIEGRTLMLRLKDASTHSEEPIPAKELMEMDLRVPFYLDGAPKEEIEEGTSWNLDPDLIIRELAARAGSFDAKPTSRGSVRLARVSGTIATITAEGRIEGKTMGGVDASIDFELTSELDLEGKRLRRIQADVKTRMDGDGSMRGSTFSVKADIRVTAERRYE